MWQLIAEIIISAVVAGLAIWTGFEVIKAYRSQSRLDKLVKTSEADAILTEDGLYLTKAGESRLRRQS